MSIEIIFILKANNKRPNGEFKTGITLEGIGTKFQTPHIPQAMLYSGLDSVISNKIAIKLALLTLKIPHDID